MAIKVQKQPNEVLDYGFDFGIWMPEGDSLTTASFASSPVGLTMGVGSISGDTAIQFVSGGTDGTDYTLTCTATTTDGRTVEREIVIEVRETPPTTQTPTPDQVKQHVETDLDVDAIQRLIDDAEEDVIARFGAETTHTDYLCGGDTHLFPTRPISAVTSITETWSDADTVLGSSDYAVKSNGWMVKRLGLRNWAPEVTIVYTPVDDADRRRRVIIDLVRVAVLYSALDTVRDGDHSETAVQYQKERERILRGLSPRQRMFA